MTRALPTADDVLAFWYGDLDADGCADATHSASWWKKDLAFDRQIGDRFGALRDAVIAGDVDDWLESPRGRLAAILVVDQFSRNMFRGTPGMYDADPVALWFTVEGLRREHHRSLLLDERLFLVMPLMHAEDLAHQDRCVALFEAEVADAPNDAVRRRAERSLDAAQRHRDIVARFGRFPHRNDILGRPSTDAELDFLLQPGSSF